MGNLGLTQLAALPRPAQTASPGPYLLWFHHYRHYNLEPPFHPWPAGGVDEGLLPARVKPEYS